MGNSVRSNKRQSLEKLGYFLKPSELFSNIASRAESDFILEDLLLF